MCGRKPKSVSGPVHFLASGPPPAGSQHSRGHVLLSVYFSWFHPWCLCTSISPCFLARFSSNVSCSVNLFDLHQHSYTCFPQTYTHGSHMCICRFANWPRDCAKVFTGKACIFPLCIPSPVLQYTWHKVSNQKTRRRGKEGRSSQDVLISRSHHWDSLKYSCLCWNSENLVRFH